MLAVENEDRMSAFLRRHPNAAEDGLPTNAGRARTIGRQILPGEAGMDGFYYARLRKN
jgi:16S rRNA (cytosine967-C5)-methyltransferase